MGLQFPTESCSQKFALPLSLIAFLLVAGAAFSQQKVPPASKAPDFKIAGTVVDAMTDAPLAQARVSLADTKNRATVMQLVTSDNGRFEFSNVPSGKFSLQGAKRGYLSAAYDQHEQFSTAIVTGPESRHPVHARDLGRA